MNHPAGRIAALYREAFPRSAALFERARGRFPDGVTHDGRALAPFPVHVASSQGAIKTTVEGRELVDFWSGHGALLLGHAHPAVVEAVREQVARGTHWGASHELEIRWADLVAELVPSAERVRFTSSGTEATLLAIRIARLATGRTKVLKFAGHFHGWHDQLIPSAYPSADGVESEMPGITPAVREDLVVVPPNDPAALEAALAGHRPACAILEPTGGRWGTVPIRGEFLRTLRELTKRHGTLLIFDEVITGFRVDPGGAQAFYDVRPDLTTLAKVLAGGLPGGAVVGRADLLEALSAENRFGRKIPHHGTYNANPLSAAAGTAALDVVRGGAPCRRATEIAAAVRASLEELFVRESARLVAYGDFSMIRILPGDVGPRETWPGETHHGPLPYGGDHALVDRPIDRRLTHAFRCALLLGGVDWMGWGGLTNAAMGADVVDRVTTAFAGAIRLLREDGFEI